MNQFETPNPIAAAIFGSAPLHTFFARLFGRLWIGLPLLTALALLGTLAPSFSQDKQPVVVYVAPVEGMIDLGLAPFVQRVLDEATQAGAAAVILDINTFGGRVDAAVQIRDALLNARIRTVAFVNKRAISAGALIIEISVNGDNC